MTIEIKIEHTHYHHLLETTTDKEGYAVLTTLQPRQKSAVIKFFLHRGTTHRFLTEYLLDLSWCTDDKPLIEVRGAVKKRTLVLSISVEGKGVCSDTLTLPRSLPPKRAILLFSSGILLLAAIIFFLPGFKGRNHTAASMTAPAVTTATTTVAPPPPAPLPPPTKGSIPVHIKKIIYFYPDSTRMKEGEKKKIDEVVELLAEHPGLSVTVSGFCARYGTQKGRMELSRNRARFTAALLEKLGWRPNKPPSILWFGAQNPLTTDPLQKDKNRRVEITVTSE